MTVEEALTKPTITIIEAGELFFGLSKDASYRAARAGDIPTIPVGGVKRVPVMRIAEMLGLRANIGGKAA
ncbi:DNA-binding protein [Ochrobactrum sp. C6C9]|uniref:DNA-binding protein n=1 Tax=Ochrobactrum sp. C6C9 TaxID=2736662 RepID=UPI0035302784|nr:DNA-binding protein [Ochrobactrum sp. C6C9]